MNPLLFVSYAREDYETVSRFASSLRSLGIETWIDVDSLRPGEKWEPAIRNAIGQADGLLFFVSKHSMSSRWVKFEIDAMVEGSEMLVIPVILDDVPDLPSSIQARQWIDLRSASAAEMTRAASVLARSLTSLPPSRPRPSTVHLDALAMWTLAKARGQGIPRSEPAAAPAQEPLNSIFVVHGHDSSLREDVVGYVVQLKLHPVILSRVGEAQQSLFQKFMNSANDSRFAIVLLSADDLGTSRAQYEAPGVGDRSLQFRARQNVIFELGFFYGRLGWENVFVVYKPPTQVFPNFEHPSDLLGTVFDEMDSEGAWRTSLSHRLARAGFQIAQTPEM
jgi:predicted nucleotide-binding protein